MSSKARTLADFVSTGGELADGQISVSEISDLTASAAELNTLDGITATVTELNYTDGVTSNIQTQIDNAVLVVVITPTNTSPADDDTDIQETPTLTASSFASLYGYTHDKSQWQVSESSNFNTTVYDSGEVNDLESHAVPSGNLSTSTEYYWRVRYKNSNGDFSEYSTATTFTTDSSFGPETIGESFGGGFYGGKINDGGTEYYLIVAPKSSGEDSSKQWKTSQTTTSGTTSTTDGPSNTSAMNNASHPAAEFCAGLSIGGFSDWYMPAQDELEVLYYNLKPTTTSNNTSSGTNTNAVPPRNSDYTSGDPAQTSVTDFQTGNTEAFASPSYWSSTENSSSEAFRQNFTGGDQTTIFKDNSYYVRAVRRLAV
jgi:hypothetical protein